ncbi:hypothetical protein BKA93DRAFT_753639 [Sparassis latifolia]
MNPAPKHSCKNNRGAISSKTKREVTPQNSRRKENADAAIRVKGMGHYRNGIAVRRCWNFWAESCGGFGQELKKTNEIKQQTAALVQASGIFTAPPLREDSADFSLDESTIPFIILFPEVGRSSRVDAAVCAVSGTGRPQNVICADIDAASVVTCKAG